MRPTGFSGSLLGISVILLGPVCNAPQYSRMLTKPNSPLKKDPIALNLCTLKLALSTGLILPPLPPLQLA